MKRCVALFAACFFVGLFSGKADVMSTPEVTAIDAVSVVIGLYAKEHNGQLPVSWDQLRNDVDLEKLNQSVVGWAAHPIEDHYAFINQPLSLPDSEGSRVLLIRTVPLELGTVEKDNHRQWRYLIVRRQDGRMVSVKLPEASVQTMLQKAGITIAPKAGLPAVESAEPLSGAVPQSQPNPADAEYLRQHPELDPTGARVVSAPFPPPSATARPIERSIPTPTSQAQHYPSLFPILSVILIGMMVAGITHLFLRRK